MELMLLLILASAALLLLAGVFAFCWPARERRSVWRLVSVSLLVIFSIVLLRLPLYLRDYPGHAGEPFPTAVLHSVVSGMQTVGLNESLDGLFELSRGLLAGGGIRTLYDGYTALQYVCAPLFCGYTLVRVLIDLRARMRLRLCRRPVYFFTELSEESVIFAGSIDENVHHTDRGRRPLFCFCLSGYDGEYKTHPNWQRAQEIGAIAVPGHLSARLFPRGADHVTCVLCSRDENENVKDLSRLLHEEESGAAHGRRARTVKHFVFGSSAWAEKAIDTLAESCAKDSHRAVFMLNPKEDLAAYIMDRYPLYAYCGQAENGRRRINVLVVGSTPLADWFLRTAYACGQLHECDLSITLADRDAAAYRDRLMLSAPMLSRTEHPLVQECGRLNFVTLGQTQEAADAALLADKDYIFLALEEDEQNAMLAGRIASWINRQKLTDAHRAAQRVAVIYSVQDAGLSRLCSVLTPQADDMPITCCETVPVGDRESCCRVEVLLEHEMMHKAFFQSQTHGGTYAEPDAQALAHMQEAFAAFMNNAYKRRSSMAFALQTGYYLEMIRRGGEKAIDALEDAEHRRWAAYTIMDGYDEPAQAELEAYLCRGGNTHKSIGMRLHPCLVSGRNGGLERMSKTLDGMLLARIEAALSGEHIPMPAGREDLSVAIAEAASLIEDERARAGVLQMSGMLYTDYRAYDRRLLERVEEICRMVAREDVQRALNRFWQ